MKSTLDGFDGIHLVGESAMHLPFLGLNRAIHDPKSWPRAASVMASTQGWLMRRSIDIA